MNDEVDRNKWEAPKVIFAWRKPHVTRGELGAGKTTPPSDLVAPADFGWQSEPGVSGEPYPLLEVGGASLPALDRSAIDGELEPLKVRYGIDLFGLLNMARWVIGQPWVSPDMQRRANEWLANNPATLDDFKTEDVPPDAEPARPDAEPSPADRLAALMTGLRELIADLLIADHRAFEVDYAIKLPSKPREKTQFRDAVYLTACAWRAYLNAPLWGAPDEAAAFEWLSLFRKQYNFIVSEEYKLPEIAPHDELNSLREMIRDGRWEDRAGIHIDILPKFLAFRLSYRDLIAGMLE